MKKYRLGVLENKEICTELQKVWKDSQPGASGGHEEGGFILRKQDDTLVVSRWPKGELNNIFLPPHQNCKFDNFDILASFHTHPNTGSDFFQEPSVTDKRAIRDDLDLKGEFYEGELVISEEKIYVISPNGHVDEIGERKELLG